MTTLSISSKGDADDKLQWAFKMYDLNGDGQVSRSEATEIIHVRYHSYQMSATPLGCRSFFFSTTQLLDFKYRCNRGCPQLYNILGKIRLPKCFSEMVS